MSEILLYFSLLALAICLGALIPLLRHRHITSHPLFLSLSAGLMLGSSFIHLIPESFELAGSKTSFAILAGFLLLYLFERFVTVHICETSGCEVHHLGFSAFIGLFIHSFVDGIALGAGFLFPQLGFIIFLAILAHKGMEAFSLTSILLHEKKRALKVGLANGALFAALPLGVLTAFWVVPASNPSMVGLALGFSAGTFLHISFSDLLPEVHRHSHLKNRCFLFFILGLGFMFFLSKLLTHSHTSHI